MDPQENTKNIEKDQEPENKIRSAAANLVEPARRCQICEGPNHHACGCEARAAKEKSRIDLNALPAIHYTSNGRAFCTTAKPGEKTTEIEFEVTCKACQELLKPKTGPGPYAEPDPDEEISEDILKFFSHDLIKEAREQSLQQTKDIHTMAAHFEDIFTMMNDAVAFLKIIADDMITIRKIIQDEYTDAEKPKNPV